MKKSGYGNLIIVTLRGYYCILAQIYKPGCVRVLCEAENHLWGPEIGISGTLPATSLLWRHADCEWRSRL